MADYWRDQHFDLSYYLQHDWATLGPKLAGKLHVYVGDMDNYYLNLAVYRLDNFLKSTTAPRSDAIFQYGRPMKGHGWQPMSDAELVRMMADRITRSAPEGADTTSWKY